MIEKMKKIIVVAPQERKASLLSGIRDLGVIHITEKAAPDADLSAQLAEYVGFTKASGSSVTSGAGLNDTATGTNDFVCVFIF